MIEDLLTLMGTMFLLMVTGYVLRKINVIRTEGKSTLVDLIIYLVLPCTILNACIKEFTPDFWEAFPKLLCVGLAVQLISMIAAGTCYRMMPEGEKEVYQYGTVCPNSGFMGYPLIEGIFGSHAVILLSVILIPQRVAMWTAGVSYFQKGSDKKAAYKKVLKHPCMIATYIGFFIMLTNFKVPAFVTDSVAAVSSSCTALTMIYIGSIIVDSDIKGVINIREIYFAVIRLILIPLALFIIFKLVGVDALSAGVGCIAAATPAGSTTSVLAAKYHADESAAAKSVVFTTLLSVITIPLWSMVLLSQI